MRVDVQKYLFVGAEADRLLFFKKAQEFGVIEFIDSKGRDVSSQDEAVHTFLSAIKILRGLPPVEQKDVPVYSRGLPIAKKILDYQQELEQLREQARLTYIEAARVSIFGDFSIEDLHFIEVKTQHKIQFFYSKKPFSNDPSQYQEVIPVGVDDGLHYFMALSPISKVYPGLTEIKIEASYGELKKKLSEINRQIHSIEAELKPMNRYNSFLHQALVKRMDEVHLTQTQARADHLLDGTLFAVEGWVPISKIKKLGSLCEEMHVHTEEIAFEKEDRIPTYLENKGAGKLGEDLVHIYDTPSITDADPSKWVLWAFALFFGIIIEDAGYGFIFLGISIYLYYRFPDVRGLPKRTIKLCMLLSVACIVWGMLTGSYFGLNFDINNPLRKASIVTLVAEKKAQYHIQAQDSTYKEWIKEYPQLSHVTDAGQLLSEAKQAKKNTNTFNYPLLDELKDSLLFEFSLFVGCTHVCISLLRNIRRHWASIGWVIFIIGAYLYFPMMLDVASFFNFIFGIPPLVASQVGLEMIYVGIGIAIVLGLIQKKLAGSLEVMTLIQIAVDVLSYLRLYALGLAGLVMARTFNEMAETVGMFFGIFVILAGHLINMGLAIMSGVIHGLRLNFLEWYHYSFEGGGKPFKPLALLSKRGD
jgi:V/A-type H+-transporting ATPase subunit I